jgi:deoxycytidylate deaminase
MQPIEDSKNAELVFGLVAPIGTDAMQVAENLASQLAEFKYAVTIVRLSDLIAPMATILGVKTNLSDAPEYERILTRITGANKVYREFNARSEKEEKNAMLALAAVEEISRARRMLSPGDALLNEAHVLATLKRPEEVAYLRSVYGHGFHLIGVFAPEDERIKHLHRHKGMKPDQAKDLVQLDVDDHEEGGQRTGDAFHLADVFLDVSTDGQDWKRQLGRFLDVLFSHPYKTPTRDEQAMFMAYAASLRSAQFGRQVGAAITSNDGDILSVGCNEVPKAGGGQYWDRDVKDERDHHKGSDSNTVRKNEILDEIMDALPPSLYGESEVRSAIKKTSLFHITEFGRAVHAEMEAILSCGRKGISTVGRILYTTTFPCHNCARHIIGAGISKVVYIEPYPKSKAKELHDDAIQLGDRSTTWSNPNVIPFVPFVGISPSKYSQLFDVKPVYSREVDRKLHNGQAINWQRSRTQLRSSMVSISYVERETRAISRLEKLLHNQLTLDMEGPTPNEDESETNKR